MSKKTSVSSRTRPMPVCKCLAAALLMFGLAPAIFAQPAPDNTWNTTLSFTGTGNLPVGNFFGTGVPDDVLVPLTTSMSGTGVNTANANGSGGFTVNSSFNATVGVGGVPGNAPFSISQPHGGGPDPGIPMTTPSTTVTPNTTPPFYGLYPPPAGTEYTSVANVKSFARGFSVTSGLVTVPLQVNFSGPVSLTLGSGTPTLSITPDGSLPGDDFYSYSYDDSTLALNPTVSGFDPPVDFTGTVVITTVAAAVPETSGLLGDILLLALFAIGVKCSRLKIETGSPA